MSGPTGGSGGPEAAVAVGVLLAVRRQGTVDVGERFGSDLRFEAGGDLALADASVDSVLLGDRVAGLSVRDQVQLLMECRRVLREGGRLLCVEAQATQTCAALARWAEFVGLVADDYAPGTGWRKRVRPRQSEPLVSILIPSSNPRYFADCVDSALAQTYRDIEVIVCDDCDSDAVGEIARRYADPRLRYIKNPERLRARRNYEKLLSLASGEYVKFLNDDDALEPGCVGTFVAAFEGIADLTLATSHRWRIDEHSQIIEDMHATQPVIAADRVIDGVSLGNAVVMYGINFVGEPSTAMFRRSDFAHRPHIDGERPFHFNGQEIHGSADLAMWSRLWVQGKVAFFADRLSRFRTHGAQAQARDDVIARSTDGMRGLQQQWIELGLFRRAPPHLIRCRPIGRDAGGLHAEGPWRYEPLIGLPHAGLPPEDAVRAWRAVRKHPFDV